MLSLTIVKKSAGAVVEPESSAAVAGAVHFNLTSLPSAQSSPLSVS